jgi:hypothetical protein
MCEMGGWGGAADDEYTQKNQAWNGYKGCNPDCFNSTNCHMDVLTYERRIKIFGN